jgi:hypothetical protein
MLNGCCGAGADWSFCTGAGVLPDDPPPQPTRASIADATARITGFIKDMIISGV